MKIALTFFLFGIFATNSVLGADCPECWEQCFTTTDASQFEAYGEIHQIVTSLRSARHAYGIEATHFAFDATEANNQRYNYQKMLAAIVSLTLPTDPFKPCPNPLYVAKYYSLGATMTASGMCQPKCKMANYITVHPTMGMGTQFLPFQWVTPACWLSNFVMNYIGGQNCERGDRKTMLVVYCADQRS